MITKAYLVLSVGDIRRLLKLAKDSARKAKLTGAKASAHCIALDHLEVDSDFRGMNTDAQVSSASLNIEVDRQQREL